MTAQRGDPQACFCLGEWLVEPSLDRVSKPGTSVQLEPRIMDVLVYLCARAGRVVSRRELVDAVWARQFVAESALSRAVAELRRALGDDARAPQVIETITKRGYRLIAVVEAMPPVQTAASQASAMAGVSDAAPPCVGYARASDSEQLPGAGTYALKWKGREIPLPEGESVIGRDPGVLVRIGAWAVSRRHARIAVSGGRAVLEDLGSKNGTYLCGTRITEPCTLEDGDTICVGPAELVFLDLTPAGSTKTQIR